MPMFFHRSSEGSLVIYVKERMTEHVYKDEQHDKKKLKSFWTHCSGSPKSTCLAGVGGR